MSKIILYGIDLSPPVRAVYLTLKELNVPFEYKVVDLFQGEHLTDEFLKRNPQHTVPVLDDNGVWIWDSHAICCYLIDKYGQNDELYPKDLVKRALINQRLYFEASVLFMSLRNISIAYFRDKNTVVPKEKTVNVLEGYALVEAFLGDKPYLAGDNLSVADFCTVATISSLVGLYPLDPEKHSKTLAWLARLEKLPYYEEANGKGVKAYIALLKSVLTEIQC